MPRFRLRSRFPWLVVRRRSGDADDDDSEADDRGLLASLSLPLRAVRRVRSFFSRRSNTSTTTDPFADPLPPTFNDRYEHHLRKYEAEAARTREKYSFDTEPLPLTPASKRRQQRRRKTSLFTNTSSPSSSTPWRTGGGHNANTDSPSGSGGGIKLSRLIPRTPKTPTRKGRGKGKNKNTDADDAEEEARREKRRQNVHDRIHGRYDPDNDDDHISLESWEEIWFNLGNDRPATTNANASASTAGPSGTTNADPERNNTGRNNNTNGDDDSGNDNIRTIERLASVDETQEPAEEEEPHTPRARQMPPRIEEEGEEKGEDVDADNTTTTNTTDAPTPPPTSPATVSGDDTTSQDEGQIQDFNANITTGPGQSWRKLV
ncbi:hypothetical protein ABEF95_005527 [Exophiala dermatitidis]|uniref:Uncharacterized protein n=1 Tax=Exophiala dermatitidis (strain ATCC 34100 / CBS 525.76 / NIH/UT8656) TaxID=858893 RepID=H6BPV4_EXODN